MIDAVLSYHTNPQTCGVAKFNQQLAQRLGVPCLPLTNQFVGHALVSIKASEVGTGWEYEIPDGCTLLLHDRPTMPPRGARRWFYADEIGCPSTISGTAHRGTYRVLVFGMAHKLVLPYFESLKGLLDDEHPDYTIELSTAVHEGSPWDEALTHSIEAMRGVFGDKLRVLGYLGDDALAKELQDVDAVALYYLPALRANNTTYWAAVEAGKTIYTNRDALSPREGDPAPSWDNLLKLLQ